mgnify:CR=1 FL=1
MDIHPATIVGFGVHSDIGEGYFGRGTIFIDKYISKSTTETRVAELRLETAGNPRYSNTDFKIIEQLS